jgi:hypothetical protein
MIPTILYPLAGANLYLSRLHTFTEGEKHSQLPKYIFHKEKTRENVPSF